MQISSINTAVPTVPGATEAARVLARPAGVRPSVPKDREPTPPPGLSASSQMVEFDRHAGTGAQVVKFIDRQSGEVINEFPAEQVLDAVTNLMRMMQESDR